MTGSIFVYICVRIKQIVKMVCFLHNVFAHKLAQVLKHTCTHRNKAQAQAQQASNGLALNRSDRQKKILLVLKIHPGYNFKKKFRNGFTCSPIRFHQSTEIHTPGVS